jgi:O-antigen biosynthesis protein
VKILVVHPEGNVNYNANLLGLLELLGEAGHTVTYVAPRRPGMSQGAGMPSVSTRLLENREAHGQFVFPVARTLGARWARDFAQWQGHDLVLGIDRGIIEASWIARHYGKPHALISYEIFFRAETTARFKAPEVEACHDLAFATCQDAVRSHHLCVENGIAADKVVRIPVAGRGFRGQPPKPRLLHEQLRLPPQVKTLLHIGSFADWTHAAFLLESTRAWPRDWVLVIHERYGASAVTRALIRKHADPDRVRVSEAAFANACDMSAFVQSADLGIALYRPDYKNKWIGRNIEHIGLSSGKISTCLQQGVPVATHELGEISDLIRTHGAGQVFSLERPFVPEAPHAASAEACRNLFEQHLDLDRFGKGFLHAVAHAEARSSAQAQQGA